MWITWIFKYEYLCTLDKDPAGGNLVYFHLALTLKCSAFQMGISYGALVDIHPSIFILQSTGMWNRGGGETMELCTWKIPQILQPSLGFYIWVFFEQWKTTSQMHVALQICLSTFIYFHPFLLGMSAVTQLAGRNCTTSHSALAISIHFHPKLASLLVKRTALRC